MSVAPSIPSIKIKISPPSHPCRFSLKSSITVIRSSKADGPMRRPAAPSLSPSPPSPPPLSPPPSISPAPPPMKPATPSQSPPKPEGAAVPTKEVVTLEYQRRVAKELQEYFKQKKLEEADQGPFFGFMGKNEIINGSPMTTITKEKKKMLNIIMQKFGIGGWTDSYCSLNSNKERFACLNICLMIAQVGNVWICSWVANRVCDRLGFCSTAKDPSLQFWDCGLGMILIQHQIMHKLNQSNSMWLP